MVDINRYRMARYVDGGRGPVGYDCWGLVRDALHHVFGFGLLPTFGGVSAQTSLSPAAEVKPLFQRVDKVAKGCVLAGYIGQRVIHVGIAISPTRVLHASKFGGVIVQDITAFSKNAGSRIEVYQCLK